MSTSVQGNTSNVLTSDIEGQQSMKAEMDLNTALMKEIQGTLTAEAKQ